MQQSNQLNIRPGIASQIGELVLGTLELSERANQLEALVASRHELLASMFKSNELPESLTKLLSADSTFSQWYAQTYVIPKSVQEPSA